MKIKFKKRLQCNKVLYFPACNYSELLVQFAHRKAFAQSTLDKIIYQLGEQNVQILEAK